LAPNQKHGIVKEQENIGPVFAVLRLVSWGKIMHHDFRQRWAEAKRQYKRGRVLEKPKSGKIGYEGLTVDCGTF